MPTVVIPEKLEPIVNYTVQGTEHQFTFKFFVVRTEDLFVYVNNKLVDKNNYTVTGFDNPQGGYVDINKNLQPLVKGDHVTLFRFTLPEQLTEFIRLGDFTAVSVNTEFNRLYALMQELRRDAITKYDDDQEIEGRIHFEDITFEYTGRPNSPVMLKDYKATIVSINEKISKNTSDIQALGVKLGANLPILPWVKGGKVINPFQRYMFTIDKSSPAYGFTYNAPSASESNQVVMGDTPVSDDNWHQWDVSIMDMWRGAGFNVAIASVGFDVDCDMVIIDGNYYPLSRPVSGVVESITYGKNNNYGEMVVSGVKTYLLDIKYFDAQRYDARAFGAIDDYYKNTPLHECGKELDNWYNECCSLDKPMIIVGDYYSEKGLVWSNNLGLHKRRDISASASINFDLKDGSKIGLYTGYDHAFGIYHQQVTGVLKINYVGDDNNGLTGFYFDKGAYGDYGIIPSGWDVGYHNHGSIGCIIKGSKEKTANNNLDLIIESTESSPGILRFSCNIFTVEDVTLTSKCKLRIIVGPNVPDITATTGGLFKFSGVNFEGKQGDGKFGSVFHIVRTGEVKVLQAMDVVHFTQCWFEGFDETKIFMNLIYSKVKFGLQCFFAKSTKERFIQVNDDFCGVEFEGAYLYFADYLPETKCVVSRNGTATDKYRSAVVARNSVFYGPSGTAVPLHDGQVAAINHIRTTSSSGERFTVVRWGVTYPSEGATDDYLTNMSLNVHDYINDVVGTEWKKAEIVIDGGTGSKQSSVIIKATKNGFYIDHDSTGFLSVSGGNLVFPSTVKAEFFKPTVTLSAYCDVDNHPVV